MRVFQLCAGAAQGGAETAFVDVSIALHEAGIDIVPICRPHPLPLKRLRDAGLEPVTLPFGGPFDFRTRRVLRKLVHERRPDIVQTWMQRATKWAPRPSAHLPPFKLVARLGGYYKMKHYRDVDHFVTNTPDIKRYLMGKGIAENRITHINNLTGLDDDKGQVLARAEFGTPQDAFLCLSLSRLHRVKGLDVFLEALSMLPNDVHAWLAGDGPEHAALEAQAARLGLQDRVKFLGWRTDRADLLATADALVFPSRYEPFGTTFAQAWAAGCPLVTTASEGPAQYVRDGEDALKVPIDDAPALAKAVRDLAGDPNLAKSLAARGKIRFEEEFTRDACVRRYLALYKGLNENLT